jgi:signal transduction histidine kinase
LRHALSEELGDVRRAMEIASLPAEASTSLQHSLNELSVVIADLDDSTAGNPVHDHVTSIAVRPLVERIFRWQQRLSSAPHAVLHLDLTAESVNWFPARFRHILDNLVSNALKYRDPDKGQSRVSVFAKPSS